MKKLKPCPFCGQPAEIFRMTNGEKYPRCTGNSKKGYCLLTRYPDIKNDGFIFENDAIRVWNRRPRKIKNENFIDRCR